MIDGWETKKKIFYVIGEGSVGDSMYYSERGNVYKRQLSLSLSLSLLLLSLSLSLSLLLLSLSLSLSPLSLSLPPSLSPTSSECPSLLLSSSIYSSDSSLLLLYFITLFTTSLTHPVFTCYSSLSSPPPSLSHTTSVSAP